MKEIQLNGDSYTFAGATINDLLAELALAGQRLAVEVNGDIVSRDSHREYTIDAGDTVEIVQAIGGG